MHQRRRRGRSRQVSNVAVARKASEERQRRRHDVNRSRWQPVQPTPSQVPADTHRKRGFAGSSKANVAVSTTPCVDRWVCCPGTQATALPAPSPPSQPRSQFPTPVPTPTQRASRSYEDHFLLNHHDSASSPPMTLEDHLYIAYADDNIRLAKMILLKLKGIAITSLDDPRIDEVKDEDFDECFLPSGGLDAGDDRRLDEGGDLDNCILQECRRVEWLWRCGRIWMEEKRRACREKLRASRNKETERQVVVREATRRDARDPSTTQRRLRSGPIARILMADPEERSYMCSPGPSPQPLGTPSQCGNKFKAPAGSTTSQCCRNPTDPTPTATRDVTFEDVLASMHGPLFPMDLVEHPLSRDFNRLNHDWRGRDNARTSCSLRCHPPTGVVSDSPTQSTTLATLLEPDLEEFNRRRKGQGAMCNVRRRKSSASLCVSCSPTSSIADSSLSYFSLGSPTCSLTSTSATTPSTSPVYPWLKENQVIACAQLVKKSTTIIRQAPRQLRRLQLIPVAACDSPLPFIEARRTESCAQDCDYSLDVRDSLSRNPPLGTVHATRATTPSNAILGRINQLLPFAKNLQKSLLIMGPPVPGGSPRGDHSSNCLRTHHRVLRPPGSRALRNDVSAFLPGQSVSYRSHSFEPIPLQSAPVSPPDPEETKTFPPPQPLPRSPDPIPLQSTPVSTSDPSRAWTFPPPQPLPRSPYRPVTPPRSRLPRLRPVGNPVVLRLRALHNVMCERGKQWEGRASEGSLGCGRERLVGIGWEGLGRSGLGLETRVISSIQRAGIVRFSTLSAS